MLQNLCKTLGFKKNMVYKIPPGGGKPYPASGLKQLTRLCRELTAGCNTISSSSSTVPFLIQF